MLSFRPTAGPRAAVSTRAAAAPRIARSLAPISTRRAGVAVCRAAAEEATAPTVKIDNIHDPFATLVKVNVGDASEMLDTVTALKTLGLNIKRATMAQDGDDMRNVFYLTDSETSEKIVKSSRLEEIRMTLIESLSSKLPEENRFNFSGRATGGTVSTDAFDPSKPRPVVQTTINITEGRGGACSLLTIQTADRPGLLVDIVHVLKDVNLNVVSAEVDTIGQQAYDEFFVTYRGGPLSVPMQTLVTNSLQYYLSMNEVANVDSY